MDNGNDLSDPSLKNLIASKLHIIKIFTPSNRGGGEMFFRMQFA